MRLAVLILGLLLGLLMFIQTTLVYGLSSAGGDDATAFAGILGLMMALLWLVACAFVFAVPAISIGCFAAAMVVGVLGGSSTRFTDLSAWAAVSFMLMVLSFFARREKQRHDREHATQTERDARYEAMLTAQQRQAPTQQPLTAGVPCPSCGAPNPTGTRFCGTCGVNLAANQPQTTEPAPAPLTGPRT